MCIVARINQIDDNAKGKVRGLMDEIPPLQILVEDALALGYEVVVLVIDDEEEGQMWCANTGKYLENIDPNHGHDLNWIARMEKQLIREDLGIGIEDPNYLEKWQQAMEKVHGGPISSEDEIDQEEYHRKRAEEQPEHDVWFDPANPNDVVDMDSACYCGWLGINAPSKEHAPPGCNCYEGAQE